MKKALLVGINYPGQRHALRGCVNDVKNMNTMLKTHYGFNDIKMVLDNQATTTNILNSLNWLVTGAVPGDTIFFHYSGHGSQVRDNNGDEKDRMDEILCPIDLNWKNKIIRDDDLKQIFDTLPDGVNLTVCLDCCHSGSGLDHDNLYQPVARSTENIEPMGGRFLPPPNYAIADNGIEFKPKTIQSRSVNQTGLLLSGCRSNQTSADAFINGKYQGAFTHALLKVLADHRYNVSYINLIEEINHIMVKSRFTQRPELDGSPTLFLSNFLEDRDYGSADLGRIMKVQPNVDPENINHDETDIMMIILGILAAIGTILTLLI